jgi:hypothetical protein
MQKFNVLNSRVVRTYLFPNPYRYPYPYRFRYR